ncbi:hypothetical protein [Verrucosispora sp. TAA-831]|uniref:hypothetical protein n=1 Tax=Verrucosispora sp. TAA-831 TaxID=3422227 RepID=UPI003D700620
MKRLHTSVLTLACACLLALTACGGDSTDTAADTAPSVVPPSSAAPSSATPPAPDASAPSTASAADVVGDKKLCQSAKKASDGMRAELVKAMQSGGEPTPAVFKKILGGLEKEMTTLAATGGGDSKVAAALGKFSTEAGRAAAAADPATAADNPTFTKAGEDLTAACKKAGVEAVF